MHYNMPKRYPRTLSSGHNNTVIALSETEAAKLFSGDTRSDIGSEAEKMKICAAGIRDIPAVFSFAVKIKNPSASAS